MAAYWIGRAKFDDAEAFKELAERAMPCFAAHGGKVLIRGANHRVLDGQDDSRSHMIVDFPSREDAEACFASKEYQDIRAQRNASGAMDVQSTIIFD